jgi:hypothetical protein
MAIAATLVWSSVNQSRRAVLVVESLPRIESLARLGQYRDAFEVARTVERETAEGTVPEELWDLVANQVSVVSEARGSGDYIQAVWHTE